MSDDLAERLRASTNYDDRSDAADLIEAQAARIAELEAALTTALQAKDTAHIRAAHILVAAQECNRPSEEIIREDRDSWPDHQANNPIRAALEGGKDE